MRKNNIILRALALFLCLIMLIGTVITNEGIPFFDMLSVEANAEERVGNNQFLARLQYERAKFRADEYFAGNDGTGKNLMESVQKHDTCGAYYYGYNWAYCWQCYAFACQLGLDIFGIDPFNGWSDLRYPEFDANKIMPGDHIRFSWYDWTNDEHSIFVTDVVGDTIYFADANGTGDCCQIRWDVSIERSTLQKYLNNGKNLHNNNLDWNEKRTRRCAYGIHHAPNNNIKLSPNGVKNLQPFDVNVNVNHKQYNSGYKGLTFDVFLDGELIADDVQDYCSPEIPAGSAYKVDDFRFQGKPIQATASKTEGYTCSDLSTEVTLNFIFTLDINLAINPLPGEKELGIGDGKKKFFYNGIKNLTFDLYINGKKVREDTEDFCEMVMPGSIYHVKDIRLKLFGFISIETKQFKAPKSPYGVVNTNSETYTIVFSGFLKTLVGLDPIPAHAPKRAAATASVKAAGASDDYQTESQTTYSKVQFYVTGTFLTHLNSSSSYHGSPTPYQSYVRPLQYIEPSVPCWFSTAWAGTRSDNVAWIQREIKKLGYSNMPVDGYYGNTTAAVVRQFQADFDLPVTGVISAEDIFVIKKPIKKVKAPTLRLTTPESIPSGGIATVTWAGVEYAESYNIYVYNSAGELVNSAVNTKANTASFVLYNAGEYTIKAISDNERFTSQPSTLSTKVTVFNPRHVQFVDWDGTVLSNQFVEYGKAARTPASPERDGYTFSKWDKDYSAVTADETIVRAVYTRNQYKVKFLNTDGKELYTDLCYFGDSASAPDQSTLLIRSGYAFVGWDRDFSNITEDVTVKPIIEWVNTNIPIIIDACSASRDGSYGYNVSVDIRNYNLRRTNGRVVVALKTSSNRFITMTESAAFTLAASGETTMEVFVPSSSYAAYVDVFVVDAYSDLIPISEPKRITTGSTNSSSATTRELYGTLSPSLAGKQAILFIYKIDEASDYTNEYVGQAAIESDGSYSFTYQLREEPTAATGDFSIALGVEGADKVINLGTIQAPKAVHTVKIVDFDGKVLSTQKVTDGENAVLPTENPSREGYTFAGWDYTNTSVHEDLTIRPVYVQKTYTVVFIDWTNERFDLQTYYHGEPLAVPALSSLDAYETIGWEGFTDGMCVTQNMVITAKYEKKNYSVTFYDEDGHVINEQNVDYGQSAVTPVYEPIVYCQLYSVQESDNKIFLGWNTDDYSYVTEDMDVHPLFAYAEDAAEPTASLAPGVYDSSITLALSAGEGEEVYYSLDGETFETYTQPVVLTETATVAAYSTAPNKENSIIVRFTYVINRAGDEANWQYPVTVYSNKIAPDVFLVPANETLNLAEMPVSFFGQEVEGMYADPDFADPYDPVITVNNALDIYVNFAGETYTVTFKDAAGNVVDTQNVNYLGHAEAPEMPAFKDDRAFAGWDTNDYMFVTSDLVVTAVYKDPSQLNSIRLDRSSYTMMEGYTHTLSAEYTGENVYEVFWTSDNDSIATVDENGSVAALRAGTVTITATILGTDVCDSCEITVEKNPDLSLKLRSGSTLHLENGFLTGISPAANTAEAVKASFESANVRIVKNGIELADDAAVGTGTVIVLFDGNDVEVESAILVVTGDLDGNGVVNNADVSHLVRYNVGKETLTESEIKAADTNLDGSVNNRDASKLSRYLVGKESL